LAAAATILSVSDRKTEREMAGQVLSSEQSMKTSFQDAKLTLQQDKAAEGYGITMAREQIQELMELVELVATRGRSLSGRAYQPTSSDDELHPTLAADDISNGWRPMPLRVVSKVALQVAVIAVTIALGIMLWASKRSDGLCRDTELSLTALTLGISTVLVLLGYWFADVDGAAQSLSAFNVLQQRPNRHSLFTDDLTLLGRLSGLGSGRINLALLASVAYIMGIAAMKLVAAGLFSSFNTQVVAQRKIQADNSLTLNLERTFNYSHPEPLVKRACDFAEWEWLGSFDLRPRAGIIENLVLTNVVDIDGGNNSASDGILDARVSAVMVDVQCETIPSAHFNLSITLDSDGRNMTFSWFCGTERCN
jgi:hypothetical protein